MTVKQKTSLFGDFGVYYTEEEVWQSEEGFSPWLKDTWKNVHVARIEMVCGVVLESSFTLLLKVLAESRV